MAPKNKTRRRRRKTNRNHKHIRSYVYGGGTLYNATSLEDCFTR